MLLRKDPFLSSLLDERIHSCETCEYSKENRKERPDNESSSLSSKLSSLSIQIPDPRFLSVASDYYFSSNLYRIDSKNRFSSTLAPPILLYFSPISISILLQQSTTFFSQRKGKVSTRKKATSIPPFNQLIITRGVNRGGCFEIPLTNDIYGISADRFTRASGRMGSGTDSAWRPVDVGYTGASGRRDSRVDTASGNRPRPRRGTRARGRAVSRMDTVQRPTPTVVSSALIRVEMEIFRILLRVGGDIIKLVNGSLSIFTLPFRLDPFPIFKGFGYTQRYMCVRVCRNVLSYTDKIADRVHFDHDFWKGRKEDLTRELSFPCCQLHGDPSIFLFFRTNFCVQSQCGLLISILITNLSARDTVPFSHEIGHQANLAARPTQPAIAPFSPSSLSSV